jgi:pimeloyl-ACP methyl ester carboxylesterase
MQKTDSQRAEARRAPPEDMLQGWLVGVWTRLLGRADLGIDDDFFALGGTHELGERMFADVATLCGERVSALDGIGTITIRRVAELVVTELEARTRTPPVRPPPAPRRQRPAGPENILHDRLVSLWEELLGTTVAGIDDDFFAVGGTRELSERMLLGIETLYGERIEAADVDRVLTVRSLAETLLARLPETPACEIQPGARGVPPLFFLHGDLGGGGYYMRELARRLGPEQPFFAFRQHGMRGDDMPPSVEEMAADHARRVADVGSDGPVHLGGHCASAIIALEVAQQLARAGRDVASLLLVEPALLLPQGQPMLPVPRLSPAARRLPRIREAWLVHQYHQIVRAYSLPVYHGRIVVFWAGDPFNGVRTGDRPEMLAVMQRFAPRAEMQHCPGTHVSALGRHLPSLAAAIKTALTAGGA